MKIQKHNYLFDKGSLHKDMLEESSENFHPLYVVPLLIHFRIVSILAYLSGPCKWINLINTFFVISFPVSVSNAVTPCVCC